MKTGLERITNKSQADVNCRFTSLAHHLTDELLASSLKYVRNNSCPGVDDEDVKTAKASFKEWSSELISQVHYKSYRPPPVKRVYLPKPGRTEKRPIGIPTVRDRVLQRSVSQILDSVYEPTFTQNSFGGRKGRSALNAVSSLKYTISSKKVSWVFEADLKNFFGSLDHGWLMTFVEHKIGDERILTLVRRWLKAGVMEGSERMESTQGTPQGGSVSVVLSNIYLHYVLDIWFEKVVRPRMKGEAYLCRYLDDFVVCFQLCSDAVRFQQVLKKRLAKFKLELEPSKTKLIAFGRFSERDHRLQGLKSPTIEFLGFCFYGFNHNTAGNYVVGLKTASSRLCRSMNSLKQKLIRCRHLPLRNQRMIINAHLRGHLQYYGVPFNSRSLARLRRYAYKMWRKTLGRRSQKGKLTWKKYTTIVKYYPLLKLRLRFNNLTFQSLAMEL